MLIDKNNKTQELENLKQIKKELSAQYKDLKSSISRINEYFKMSEQFNELSINLSIESLQDKSVENSSSASSHDMKFLKEENRMLMRKVEELREQVDFYKSQSKRSNSALQNILRTIHDFENSVVSDMKTRPKPKEINV